MIILVFQFFSKSNTLLLFQSKSWLYFHQCSAVWLLWLADLTAEMCSLVLMSRVLRKEDFEKNWKTRRIKEAIYSEENKHHINGISFKLPTIWKPILQKNKEKKNKLENSTAKNTSPSNPSPDTSAMQTNQSAITPCKHINTTHFTIYTCLMMGEASLETSPKKQHDSRHDKLR